MPTAPANDVPSRWLGGLTPAAFMRRHWHKRPLCVRAAWPDARMPLAFGELFALAARDDVESRLVQRDGDDWRVRSGPLPRRALPPRGRPGWTLLVQGLDLHLEAAQALLAPFRFVPAARLDDLMLSYASDGGGVGPHVDSYDVFLLQLAGRRRWQIAPPRPGARLREGVPLKQLAQFEPQQAWLLEAGDMLYLPPGWGHDGVAVGPDCVTASIGFRSPRRDELARMLLERLADAVADDERLYRDPGQLATVHPGAVPPALQTFARQTLDAALAHPRRDALAREALGCWLSEPKPQVWFEPRAATAAWTPAQGLRLDRRTRMVYDRQHVYVNGESWRAAGAAARTLRALADQRSLSPAQAARLDATARAWVAQWVDDGWMHPADDRPDGI